MKIKVGEFDVLDSGSVVGNLNEPIDFIIDESVALIVRLVFIDDDSNEKKNQKIAERFDKNGLQIKFINYDNSPFGTGNISPLMIGQYNGRELYFNYRIYHINLLGKHIHYTWLLGKDVKNG
jgi:hypothetical protein